MGYPKFCLKKCVETTLHTIAQKGCHNPFKESFETFPCIRKVRKICARPFSGHLRRRAASSVSHSRTSSSSKRPSCSTLGSSQPPSFLHRLGQYTPFCFAANCASADFKLPEIIIMMCKFHQRAVIVKLRRNRKQIDVG